MDNDAYHRLLTERLAAVEAAHTDDGQDLTGTDYALLFVVAAVLPVVLLIVSWSV